MNEVFVVILNDRHSDTEVEVWTDREVAIERARSIGKDIWKHYSARTGDYVEETIKGWEFYCRYSSEGDSVCVRKTIVDPHIQTNESIQT